MKEKTMTFEEAIARLSEIVNILERGETTLDESIRLFEEGAGLTGRCQKLLKEAEQKVLKLTGSDVSEETPGQDE